MVLGTVGAVCGRFGLLREPRLFGGGYQRSQDVKAAIPFIGTRKDHINIRILHVGSTVRPKTRGIPETIECL